MNSLTTSIATLTAATGVALLATPLASAKDGDILAAGVCTTGSTSKIKLSEENGRIEVEFEVDQNRNGVRWSVAIRQRGQVARPSRPRDARAERLVRGSRRRA